MAFTEEQKAIIDNPSTHKTVVLSFPDNTKMDDIKNDKIYQESMSLTETLLDSENLTFGKCNSALFKIQVADFTEDIENARMDVKIRFNHETLGGFEYRLGRYIVTNAERTSNKRFRIISASDYMKLFEKDITNWYNNTLFPTEVIENNNGWIAEDSNGNKINLTYSKAGVPKNSKIETDNGKYYLDTNTGYVYVGKANYNASKKFTNVTWTLYVKCKANITYTESCDVSHTVNEILQMLCEYIGVTYDTSFSFVNGNLVIKRNFKPETLIAKDLLEQICEINGVFGHFVEGMLCFFAPSGEAPIKEIEDYQSCEFNDYDVKRINSLQVKTDNEDIGITITREGIERLNKYVITGNILFYGLDTETLTTVAENILSTIEKLEYRGTETSVFGNLYLGLGDCVTVNARLTSDKGIESHPFNTIIMKRELNGIQNLELKISASGNEYQEEQSSSLASQINVLNDVQREITRQMTAMMADVNKLYANKIDVENLKANVADIDHLDANSAIIGTIQSEVITSDYIKASVEEVGYITADNADLKYATIDSLNTVNGRIDTLSSKSITTDNLTAEVAKLGYAKVDFSNVGSQVVDSSMIKDGAVTNEKVLNLSANKLTSGEIDASKITVKNLNADNITVGTINGKRIGNQSITLDKLSEEVPTKEYLDKVQSDLQGQIDGAIETFTKTEIPTLNNEPANAWTDDVTRKKHIGDICYVLNPTSSADGYCYRFADLGSNGTTDYQWVLIKDSDVTKALQDIIDINGEITGIKQFDTSISSWKTDTNAELSSLKTRTTKLETDMGNKVESSVFNEVKQTVDSNTSTITSMSQTVTSVSQKADSALSTANSASKNSSDALKNSSDAKDIASSASSTASSALSTANSAKSTADSAKTASDNATKNVTTLTNTVNAVKQTADSNSASINSLQKTVSSKADGSTVTEISNKQTALEQNLNGFKTSVSETYTTKTDFNNLQIGGRNLLRNSHNEERNYTYPSSNLTDRCWWVTSTPLNGDTYTLSFWAKSTVVGDVIRVHFYKPSNIIKCIGSQGQISGNSDGECDFILSTTYTKYWVTYTIPKGGNSTRNVIIPRMFSNNGKGTISVKWEKVEEGNKATDWTPAPEDVEQDATDKANSALSESKSYIDQKANQISATVTSQQTMIDSLGKRVSTAETNLTLAENEISTKVSKNGVISAINQSSESVTINANKINLSGYVTVSAANDIKSTADSALERANSTAIHQIPVDLTGSEYDQNLYYPVVFGGAGNESKRYECLTYLGGGGTPSWATHSQGFSTDVVMYHQDGAWGATTGQEYVAVMTASFTGGQYPVFPCSQFNFRSQPIFMCRGGGRYFFNVPIESGLVGVYTTSTNLYNDTYQWWVTPVANPEVSMAGNTSNILKPFNSAWVNTWTTPNTTTIDGGKITTNTITAKQINVADLFAQNITATGTITGVTLKGANVTATSGYIGNWQISNGALFRGYEYMNSSDTGDYANYSRETILGNDGIIKIDKNFYNMQNAHEIFEVDGGTIKLTQGNEWCHLEPQGVSFGYDNTTVSEISEEGFKEGGKLLKDKYLTKFVTVSYTYNSATVSGNSNLRVTPTATNIPSGYTAIAVKNVSGGSGNFVFRSFAINGTIDIVNKSSSSATGTPSMAVICVKNQFIG